MSFIHPSLIVTWLLPLACLPILIHLINLLRHRRVRWAAMEFLLESQKRNRNWIRLKQLLLLLARVAAIAAIVLMLAGPLLSDRWSRLFAGGNTHHVLLLDDSLSMTDHWDNTSAFEAARDVVVHLVERASRQPAQQSLTLLRFSDAAAGRAPELVRQPLTADFLPKFEEFARTLAPSQLAINPLKAVEAAEKNIKRRPDEQFVVYLVSDFRGERWRDPGPVRQALDRLAKSGAKIELVRCVDRARPNLAVTSLAPAAGVRATGVPLKMDLEVTNYGSEPVHNVPVLLESQTNPDDPTAPSGRQALPAVTLERIDPGKSARQSFSAMFLTAGDHEITARLSSDAIAADNERFCVVHIPADVPVLIVDGQPGSDDALMLRLALSPKRRVRTGVRPQIEAINYLRDQPLDKFSAIYLVNVSRLDPAEVTALESFVAAGGGVVFYAGEATRPDFINESLYRDGRGIFPLPLVSQASLIVDRLDKAPDMEVDLTHPIFRRTFAGHRNSYLSMVQVNRYFATRKGWTPAADSNTRVIARLRNRAPLVVEHRYGQGVCLAVLTTAAPSWNNWGQENPTFIIALLETQVYVSSRRTAERVGEVGQPLTVELDKNQYNGEVQFIVPDNKSSHHVEVNAVAGPNPERLSATLTTTPSRGVYEARLTQTDGAKEIRRFALNVSPRAGNLQLVSADELRTMLAGVPVGIREAADFSGPVAGQAGVNLGAHWLFFVALMALLAGEQLLAYSAGYHPSRQGGRR